MKIASLTPLTLLALACSISGPDGDDDPFARLSDAVRTWEASGISDYELAMRALAEPALAGAPGCFGFPRLLRCDSSGA